jgi:hypothetical protein
VIGLRAGPRGRWRGRVHDGPTLLTRATTPENRARMPACRYSSRIVCSGATPLSATCTLVLATSSGVVSALAITPAAAAEIIEADAVRYC